MTRKILGIETKSASSDRVWDIRVLSHRLRPGADVQLFVNPANVSVDGWNTDMQRLGNLLVEIATREKLQDFAFARRKIVGCGR